MDDWTAYLDLYCERTASGLWNEPLNAMTNLAFWIAAGVVVAVCRRRGKVLTTDLKVLILLLLVVGAGSLALHTLATRAAGLADVVGIALYLHAWFVVYLHRVWHWPWRLAWLGVPGFLLLSTALGWVWQSIDMQPAAYLAAWTVLLLACLDAARRRQLVVARPLGYAWLVFACSMALRQIDSTLCGAWPHGTHFMWHLLNACTLGLTVWGLACAQREPTRP